MAQGREEPTWQRESRIALVVAALALLPGGVQANTTATFNGSAIACDVQGGQITGCASATTSGPSISVTSPLGFETASAEVTFSASNGSLSVRSDATGNDFPDIGFANSTMGATVGFSDVVTIFGGNGVGQLSFTADKSGNAFFTLGESISRFEIASSIPSTFFFGVPFQIGADVSASAVGDFTGATALAKFTLTGLSVSDANGSPLSGYTYTDASGTVYPFQGGGFVATPEPGSGFLLLFGLMLTRLRSPRLLSIHRNGPVE